MHKLAATSTINDNDTRTVTHILLVFEKSHNKLKSVKYSFYEKTYTVTIKCFVRTNFYEHILEYSQFLFQRGAFSPTQGRALAWSGEDWSCWKRSRVLFVLLFVNQNRDGSHCTISKSLKTEGEK